jgi:hypothetical protein
MRYVPENETSEAAGEGEEGGNRAADREPT